MGRTKNFYRNNLFELEGLNEAWPGEPQGMEAERENRRAVQLSGLGVRLRSRQLSKFPLSSSFTRCHEARIHSTTSRKKSRLCLSRALSGLHLTDFFFLKPESLTF